MKKKIIKTLIIFLCTIIIGALVIGIVYNVLKYKNKITDEEAVDILTELIPKSKDVNEYIWGNGPEIAEGQVGLLETVTGAQYRKVSEDSLYTSSEELKNAILEVYSNDFYEKSIKYGIFEGDDALTEDYDDFHPRYINDDDGNLCIDISNSGYDLTTEVDPTSAKVISCSFSKVNVEVEANTYSGTSIITLTLVLQDEGWRLDTPTY